MMDNIRSAANHLVVKIIFAIIILCFIFTGVGFLGFGGGISDRDAQQYIVKIDGEGLSRAAFENQAKEVVANAGELGNDQSFIRQLRQNVLSAQISNYLTYRFSQDIHASISNKQIIKSIENDRVFFDQGKFSNEKYIKLLTQNGYTPDSYADILRTALQQQQVMNALAGSDFVLPVDSELSLLENETRNVYVTEINNSVVNMDDVTISPEDEQKYYDEHQAEFTKKERIKFNYILNLKEDILPKVTVSDEEIKHEFDKDSHNEYSFPAKNAYSVIFVTNQEQANDIIKQLKKDSFADLAQTINARDENNNSQVSPYGKNGSLGWFADDATLPKPFKEANLTKIGQVSSPISVDGGYLIVKLDDKQASKKMSFDYAKFLIRKKLAEQKTDNIFEERQKLLQAALANKSESLEQAAEQAGLKMYTSDWTYFNDNGIIMRHREVRDMAFSNEMLVDGKATGHISDIIPIGNDKIDGGVVIQVVNYRPDGVAPFDEVQAGIQRKLNTLAANERFGTAVDDIMKQLNETGNAKGIAFSKHYTLTRQSTELPPEVVNMVFNLVPSATKPVTAGVQFVDNGKNAYIAILTKVTPAEEVTDISAQLLPIRENATQYYLLSDIRSNVKIEVMPNANL